MTANTLTTPQLFAQVAPVGPHRCFYCSGQCTDEHLSADYVKSSFTGLDSVTLSKFICGGCIVAMLEGIEIVNANGETKTNQKTRGYSWIVTRTKRLACTKANRDLLLSVCLSPPEPPYSICISDSGQRHLLYRTPVCWSREMVTITLEGEPITYRPVELKSRIYLCKQLAAATGKPALMEPMTPQTAMRIFDYYDGDMQLASWMAVCGEPLSRLAVWLCPPKEICANEFPGIATADPKPKHRAAKATPSLFD